jgi:hypothetical protein
LIGKNIYRYIKVPTSNDDDIRKIKPKNIVGTDTHKQNVAIACLEIRDAPDIRPDNPAFFDIRYPAGYQIALPDIR